MRDVLADPTKRALWTLDLEITAKIAEYNAALRHNESAGVLDEREEYAARAIVMGLEKAAEIVRKRLDEL